MAKSATISGSKTPGRLPKVKWEILSQDDVARTSKVKFVLSSSPVSGYSTYGTLTGTLTINGDNHAVSDSFASGASATHATITKTIPHNADGSKTVAVKFAGGIAGTSGWPTSYKGLSGNAVLDKIAGAKPAAPTGVSVTRVSDTSQTTKWTRNASPIAYKSQYVERRDNINTAWANVSGSLSATATSFTDTATQANRRYDYRVVAVGDNGSTTSTVVSINTTPAAPSSVVATKSGTSIVVDWTRNAKQAGVTQHEVYEHLSGMVGNLLATVGAVDSWTHLDPDLLVPHRYFVVAKAGSLASPHSLNSNTVVTLTPPLAPTRVSPVSVFNRAKPARVAWRHNPVDTTAQTAWEVKYQVNGGAWTTLSGTSSSAVDIPAPGVSGTLSWQIRTKGGHADFGPWTAIFSTPLASQPTALISLPAEVLGSSRATVVWAYANVDPSGQAQYEAVLLHEDLALETKSGSSAVGSVAFATPLEDRTLYTVRVRVRAGTGVLSEWVSTEFLTEFPVPVTVEPLPEWLPEQGAVNLDFTSPPPTATYAWTGAKNASPSTRTSGGSTVTNSFPDPSFETDAHIPAGAERAIGWAAEDSSCLRVPDHSTADPGSTLWGLSAWGLTPWGL